MPVKSVAVGVAALAALAVGVGPAAWGSQPLTVEAQLSQSHDAAAMASSLGSASGGVYLDTAGHAVVNVVNSQAADKVWHSGMTPRQVDYSYSTLLQTKSALDTMHAPQTAYGIDPSTDKVMVTVSDAATPAVANMVTTEAAKYGDQVEVRHTSGKFTLKIAGGDAIQNGVVRCSVGFNVHSGTQNLILTAGHCTAEGGTWSGGDFSGGQVVASDVPGADSGLITNPNGASQSVVNDGTAITSVATPTVGQSIKKSGSTSGVTSGSVFAVDQAVQFDVGELDHMTGTTVVSQPGDSGGTGYTGNAGQGTLSGGNATETFFYPLSRELSMYGVSLNT